MPPRVTVLFGTETGNSQDCADRLADSIRGLGLDAESIDMGVYDPAQLSDEALVLIVTSTFGNGDPPSNAIDLHKYVGLDSTVLDGVRFGVCALGDTTYPLFAQCGRDFDERLEARGAQRITERVECDGGFDYDEPFDAFRAACIAYLQTDPTFSAGSGPVRAASDQRSTAPSAAARPRLEQDARLVARRRLSGSASGKDTWHVELEIEGALAAYQPGDCVAVAPENDSSEVDALFQWLGPEADDGARTALVRDRCLQRVSPELLGLLAPHSRRAAELADDIDARRAFAGGARVRDLLEQAPPACVDASALLGALRPLAPRLYSIASSPLRTPRHVHFTVDAVRYAQNGRPTLGVASTWLTDRASIGTAVPAELRPHPAFRLTDDERPLLMIGPGTGVAPFRAFLHHLEELGSERRSWLFFGHRTEADDFLYGEELRHFHERGTLDRLSTAWSRQGPERVYVQHRLREQARDVWQWIDDGAVVHLCGDAQHMAVDVRAALSEIAVREGGVSDGAEWLAGMVADGRFKEDVY